MEGQKMFTMAVCVAVCLLALVVPCYSVALNGACNAADTCTTSGQYCPQSYANCASFGNCEWIKKYNTEACVDSSQCQGGTTCTSSTCSCSTGTYNTVLKLCTTLKEVGQACTASTDCYQGGTGGQAECSTTTDKCACKSGYIKDATTNQCRAPYPTEACSAVSGAPSCTSERSTGAGIVSATCTTGSCACPTGSTAKTDSNGNKACFTDVTMLANGAVCTTQNQCSSGYCLSCPGTTSTICLTASGGAGIAVNGLVMGSLMVILTLAL